MFVHQNLIKMATALGMDALSALNIKKKSKKSQKTKRMRDDQI